MVNFILNGEHVFYADLNDDGSYELLFTGYDDMIHVWNPMDAVELDGWPIDMGYNSLTEPVTADLDNDGDLEVITAMKSGMVYVFHHDGTLFNNFPTDLSGNIESSPAIGDLDGDGDFEILREIAKTAKRPLTVLLLQVHNAPNLWKETLASIKNARMKGQAVTGQVGSRPIGVLMGFQSSIHPFINHPLWRSMEQLPHKEKISRITSDEILRKKLKIGIGK